MRSVSKMNSKSSSNLKVHFPCCMKNKPKPIQMTVWDVNSSMYELFFINSLKSACINYSLHPVIITNTKLLFSVLCVLYLCWTFIKGFVCEALPGRPTWRFSLEYRRLALIYQWLEHRVLDKSELRVSQGD